MTTVDSLLFQINQNIKVIEPSIPKKDKRILLSLTRQLGSGIFLTENQGNLLVKIINENLPVIKLSIPDVDTIVSANLWSKNFRILQKFKKIYISDETPTNFVVEFSYNTRLKEKMSKISSSVQGLIFSKGSKFVISLNEHNIDLIMSTFGKENFMIEEKILNFFEEIEKIKKTVQHPFDIFSTSYEKMKEHVISDVKTISTDNLLLLQDRKFRYQYTISEKFEENSLTSKIANRETRKIHINSNLVLLTDVFDSLKLLNRFPVLLVFDGHNVSKDKKTLKILENAIKFHNFDNHVGIYFRYDKEQDKELFNYDITNLGYNKFLDQQTVIAGISNSKLPKFMVKTGWKPQSVISFTNSFRSNKSSVFCTDVDLIMYYTPTTPLAEKIHALM